MISSRILAVFLVGLCFTTQGVASTADQKVEDRSESVRQNIQGNWRGTLNSQVGKLRLILKVSKAADGKLKATMDSPDQRWPDLAVDSITLTDSFVHFEMEAIGASFDGGLSRDRSEIAGVFRQGLVSPLVLKREDTCAGSAPALTGGLIRGKIKLDPCNLSNQPPSITKDAVCGKYEVFEDRAAKSGRKIALNILILPALSAKPSPDPVFVLAGGPGQAAVGVVKAAGDYLIGLRRERDLVFIDQRRVVRNIRRTCLHQAARGSCPLGDSGRCVFGRGEDLSAVRERRRTFT